MQGLAPYVVRRLLWAIPVLFAVSVVTFALGRYGPGDPIQVRAPRADPQTIERIREHQGLNDPVPVQYMRWLGRFLRGDFGDSYRFPDRTVKSLILPRLKITIQLNVVALMVVFGLGIPLGVWAATRRGSWQDPLTIGTFLLFSAVPTVVAIPLLQWLFALKLGWFPATGWSGLLSKAAVLPIIALSVGGIAGVARFMRATTLEVLGQEFVRVARAKGLPESAVLRRHVSRNALLPMVTVIGLSLVGVLEGSFFVETLFGIPGIGAFVFQEVQGRDYDVLMAITLIIATAYIVANVVVDLSYAWIDPRIRLGESAAA